MNIRIPDALKPRLKIHADKTGLSLNAAAAHILARHLPRPEVATGPFSPGLQAIVEEALQGKLAALSMQLEAGPSQVTPYATCPGGRCTFHGERSDWMRVRARGVRVHLLKGGPVQIHRAFTTGPHGPALLTGGPALVEPGTSSMVLFTTITSADPQDITLELDVCNEALVLVELLAELLEDHAFGDPLSASLYDPLQGARPDEIRELPTPTYTGFHALDRPRDLRVPLQFGHLQLAHLEPGQACEAVSRPLPWGIWRLTGVELDQVNPGDARASFPLLAMDCRVMGGACVLPGEKIGAQSLARDNHEPLRAHPMVLHPNRVSVRLMDGRTRARTCLPVSGFFRGQLLAVREGFQDQLDDERLEAGEIG